jgi:hypothetical protein
MLSGYNLNIDDRAGKKNPADAPSHRPDYAKAPEGPVGAPESLCAVTIIIVQCNTMFCLRQLYAVAIKEEQIFDDVSPETLLNPIPKGRAENFIANEAKTALGFSGGFLAVEHNIPATLLCHYQSHWQ